MMSQVQRSKTGMGIYQACTDRLHQEESSCTNVHDVSRKTQSCRDATSSGMHGTVHRGISEFPGASALPSVQNPHPVGSEGWSSQNVTTAMSKDDDTGDFRVSSSTDIQDTDVAIVSHGNREASVLQHTITHISKEKDGAHVSSSDVTKEPEVTNPNLSPFDVQFVRRRGRPKGSKNKQSKARPPPPPKRRRGRPKKTDPPVQIPILEFPDRRRSSRISKRKSLSDLPLERNLSAGRLSLPMLDVSLDSSIASYDSSHSMPYSSSTQRSHSSLQLRSSSLMSGLDRVPLEPPENIFEDSNSSG